MGLLGILLALALLIWLAYRGWSVLLLAPATALVAAAVAREPLLAHWTQTFMGSAAQFFAQFFPLFLLGALFGKLMEDSGSVEAIARFMIERLGTGRAVLAVVLAGALVTYGGVSLFVALFVIAPMAQALFRSASTDKQYQLFVLHDADPDGYNIARLLQEESVNMQGKGYAVEVMDRYILDSTKLNPEAARLRAFLQGDPEDIVSLDWSREWQP